MRINRSVIFNRESQEYIENAFKQGLQEQGLSVRFTGKESVGPNPEDYERHMSLKINGETIKFIAGLRGACLLTKEYPIDKEDELGALVFAYRVMCKYGDRVMANLLKRPKSTMISLSLSFDIPQSQKKVDEFIKKGYLKFYIDEFRLILESFNRHYKNLKALDLSCVYPYDLNIVFF